MWKWVFLGVLLLSGVSSWTVIRYGLRPRSVPVIRPSNFENPQKLSEYIYRQMFEVLNEAPILVLGADMTSDYQKEVVRSLLERMDTKNKRIIIVEPEDAYHALPSAKIHNLEVKYKQPISAFIFEELKNVKEISKLQDCSGDIRFHVWIECNKENKLRMMRISKRAKQDQIIAVFDRISEKNWVSYIKFKNSSN